MASAISPLTTHGLTHLNWDSLIIDNIAESLLVFAPEEDKILRANTAACQLLGLNQNQILAQTLSSFFPHQRPALIVFTQSVLAHGYAWTDELSCHSVTGESIRIEFSASTLTSQGKTLVIALWRDRLAHKRLQEHAEANAYVRRGLAEWKRIERLFKDIERENQLILRAAGEGIYGVNADGQTTFVNPAAERMLGWNADQLVGKHIHDVIHHSQADGSHYPEHTCPIYAAFRDGTIHHVDNEYFWRRDGSKFHVEYTSTPIHENDNVIGAVVVFRDISDRKQAEEHLHHALAEVKSLKQRLELENAYLQEEIRAAHNHKNLVGESPAIAKVLHQIELVGPTDANVLITGESGTGKELIARAIHEASLRRDRPLIRVNCAAIPHDLFESEFFGHVKGAYTGAVKDRTGRFELADGGTLFLDEVGEIPLELQSKLLRVLQEGQFERLGDTHTRHVNVRVIAATNRNLKQAVDQQSFREDLYFRLNVFPIESIPLRERNEDIPLLAQHFLQRVSHKLNLPNLRMTQADVETLQGYNWPGNIRELENVIERAAILARQGRLLLDLPSHQPPPPRAQPMPTTEVLTEHARRQQDRNNIIAALTASGGKIFGPTGAAERLGVKPTTLASRIKRMGINKNSNN